LPSSVGGRPTAPGDREELTPSPAQHSRASRRVESRHDRPGGAPPVRSRNEKRDDVMGNTDRLAQLSEAGVSIWLDDLSRDRLRSGYLAGLIRDKHVVGITTNPTIFANALSRSEAYDEQLRELAARGADVHTAVRE